MKVHGPNVKRSLEEIAAQPHQIQMMVRDFVDLVERSAKYLPECAMALALQSHNSGEEAMHEIVKHAMDKLSSDFGAMHQDFNSIQKGMKTVGPEFESELCDKAMVSILSSMAEILGISAAYFLQSYMARMELLVEADEEVEQ